MSEPLSVLASVSGVVAVGCKISHMLYTTTKRVASVPQTVISLTKELDSLCKALEYIETIVRDHDILINPQFPADMLLELLGSIMDDLQNLQEMLSTQRKRPGEGLLRSVWKQSLFVLKEEEVREMRTCIAGHKATMDMAMAAANIAIVGHSSAKTEESLTLLAELRDEISACRNMICHDSMIARDITDHGSEENPGGAIATASRSQSRLSRCYSEPKITGKGNCIPRGNTTSTPTISVNFSQDMGALKRHATDKTTSSDNLSLSSYRAASIIDLYCDGLTMMGEELYKIDGTEITKATDSVTLSKIDAPPSLHCPNNLEGVWKKCDSSITAGETSQYEFFSSGLPELTTFPGRYSDDYFSSYRLRRFEKEKEMEYNLNRLRGEINPPYVYVVMGPRWEQWATWCRPAGLVHSLESSYEGLLMRSGGTEVLQRYVALAREKDQRDFAQSYRQKRQRRSSLTRLLNYIL